MALFMHAFPDADNRELRAQCLSTLLEYKESMQAWEEAIPILVDLDVQHWIAEALEGATHASELIGDQIAVAGLCCPSRGEEESPTKASSLSPAAARAAKAMMRAATTDPLSDS